MYADLKNKNFFLKKIVTYSFELFTLLQFLIFYFSENYIPVFCLINNNLYLCIGIGWSHDHPIRGMLKSLPTFYFQPY